MKRALLEREKRRYNSPRDITVSKRKLRVSPVEFVLTKLGKA